MRSKPRRALFYALAFVLLLSACAGPKAGGAATEAEVVGSMELQYAQQFSVDWLADGTSLITIGGADRYLLVPEDGTVPEETAADVTVLRQPLDCVCLAASSAMDFYRELGALDDIRMTSTKPADWSLPEVVTALENGDMLYVGKYSAPDYELILSEGADAVIESTMIYHSPETMETLERLGIPVLVERSSYEPDPLGRLEWIKLYGLLSGHEAEAEDFFIRQVESLAELSTADTGKTVAFFYISANGYAVVRKPEDYISRMIAMAGGEYILPADTDTEDNALSTMNMEMESFYEAARDADIIIYNSAIDGDIATVDELLSKSELLADFKAVQAGQVWCTGKNMFQQTTGIAGMIVDMNRVISGEGGELMFLHHVD